MTDYTPLIKGAGWFAKHGYKSPDRDFIPQKYGRGELRIAALNWLKDNADKWHPSWSMGRYIGGSVSQLPTREWLIGQGVQARQRRNKNKVMIWELKWTGKTK